MEIWDLCDINKKSLNKTHIRGEELQPGEYHIVVNILVLDENNNLLLTQRDKTKDYGLLWETTAGSILAGENSRQGAIRELKEETGIDVSDNEIILLGTLVESSCLTDTYVVKNNFEISNIKLQEGETICAKKVSIDQFMQMINNNEVAQPTVDRFLDIENELNKFIHI